MNRPIVLLVLLTNLFWTQAHALSIFETTSSLQGATLQGLKFEAGLGLNVVLNQSGSGVLETATIVQKPFDRAIVSWNGLTPTGTWLELSVRARIGSRWTTYYQLAKWSTDPALERRSYASQSDADGFIDTDTLKLKSVANAIQIRVRFLSQNRQSPKLNRLVLSSFSSRAAYTVRSVPSNRLAWGMDLVVPVRSQMIYPNGGEVWCSPTTITMLLEYWGNRLGRNLADTVPQAVAAVWDKVYDGGGNWVLNTAYLGTKGLSAYVTRLDSLSQAEAYIRQGIPLVVSIKWKLGALQGAKLPSSNGHILLLRGFTKNGDPSTNDPAGKTETKKDIVTVYNRTEFERAWIEHSGGVVYVVKPS